MKDLRNYLDKAYKNEDPEKLSALPFHALKGVSKKDNELLEKALGVKDIEDWAKNPAVQAAQKIAAHAPKVESTFRFILPPRRDLTFRKIPMRINHYELNRDHGARQRDINQVLDYARKEGLKVISVNPLRRFVDLKGEVEILERLFDINLRSTYSKSRRQSYSQLEYTIPEELQGTIEGVIGLESDAGVNNNRKLVPHGVAGVQGFRPEEVARHYMFPQEYTGAGQTVGVVALGGRYSEKDLLEYLSTDRLTHDVSIVSVDGAVQVSSEQADIELMMDIQMVAATAPDARIVVYLAPNSLLGLIDAVSTAVHDTLHKPDIITISWGMAEDRWNPLAMKELDRIFKAAASLGITVLAASGDNGSSDGIMDGYGHVDFPASSPHVTACGGTSINLNEDEPIERVWSDDSQQLGSGGGVSSFFPKPVWQEKVHVPVRDSGYEGRGVPDIAASSDPRFGYLIRVNGKEMVGGGTSAVAPLMAGFVARLNEARGSLGNIGFLNPHLYELKVAGFFHDIKKGNNGKYLAASGWDPCTGLGRPIGSQLAEALVSHNPVVLAPVSLAASGLSLPSEDMDQNAVARVVTGSIGHASQDLSNLKSFIDWLGSSDGKASLSSSEFSDLWKKSLEFQQNLTALGYDLNNAEQSWSAVLSNADNIKVSKVYAGSLASQISTAKTNSEKVRASSTSLHTLSQDLLVKVKERKANYQNEAVQAQQNMDDSRNRMAKAQADQRAAESELRGGKGFLNGFLTGITFTAYNPVQDNLDKARNAYNTAVSEYNRYYQERSRLNSSLASANTCQSMIERLSPMIDSVTDLQNLIVSVDSGIAEALKDQSNAASASKEAMLKFWTNRLGKEMDALAQWAEVLQHGTSYNPSLQPRVVSAVASPVPNWLSLYKASAVKSLYLPIPQGAELVTVNNYYVQKGDDHTSGFLLCASDLSQFAPDKDTPWIIVCDVLRLDNDLMLSQFSALFARRIEILNGSMIILDHSSEGSDRDFLLYVQEIKDNQDQDVGLSITRVKDGKNEERDITLDTSQGTSGAIGLLWPEGKEIQNAAPLDPAYLLDGQILQVFLTSLFQLSLLMESSNKELTCKQYKWIGVLASANPDTVSMAQQAMASASRITAELSLKSGATLVPPLDPDVYKEDIRQWVNLLNTQQTQWQILNSDKQRSESFLSLAEAALEDKNDQEELTSKLLDQAQNARDNALKAWRQAYNDMLFRKDSLSSTQTDFQVAIDRWQAKETRKAIFNLTKDSALFLVEVGVLVGELVVAPELAAPSAAKLTNDVMQGGTIAISMVAGAATAAGAGSSSGVAAGQSVAVNKTSVVVSLPGKKPSPPPTNFQKAKSLAGKIGPQAKKTTDAANNVMADVEKLIAIGKQAGALRKGADDIHTELDNTMKNTQSSELQGIDVVTGGKQYWEHLELNVENIFENYMPSYKDIEGGIAFQQAFRHLLVTARAVCETRLALASAENSLSEAIIRKNIAQKGKERAEKRKAELEKDVNWDQVIAQIVFNRIVDTKRAIYLLCEQYRRALKYFTLLPEEKLPPLPDLREDYNRIQQKVNGLTSQSFRWQGLQPLPQEMSGTSYLVPASLQKQVLDSGNIRYVVTFNVDVNSPGWNGFGRVRISEIIPNLVNAGATIAPDAQFSIVSSGQYRDVPPLGNSGDEFVDFVSTPLKLRITPTVKGAIPEGLQQKYFMPTPFSSWTVMIDSLNEELPPDTKLLLKFNGQVSPK